jgi:hypothetical protein
MTRVHDPGHVMPGRFARCASPSSGDHEQAADGEREEHHRPGQLCFKAAFFGFVVFPGRHPLVHGPIVGRAVSRARRVHAHAALQEGGRVPDVASRLRVSAPP